MQSNTTDKTDVANCIRGIALPSVGLTSSVRSAPPGVH